MDIFGAVTVYVLIPWEGSMSAEFQNNSLKIYLTLRISVRGIRPWEGPRAALSTQLFGC